MSAVGRLRRLARRVRGVPGQLDAVETAQRQVVHESRVREEEVLRRLDSLASSLAAETARIRSEQEDDITAATRHLVERLRFVELQVEADRGESTARHDQNRNLTDQRLGALEDRMRGVLHELRVVQEAARQPARTAAAAGLVASLPGWAQRRGPRRPGLSVLTITWNHAGWLTESLASARAAVDALPEDLRGPLLVLDDASTDETASLLTQLAADDPNLRVLSSPVNLGLGHARNVLLAACPTSHAVVLDADNRLLPAGVDAVYKVAREFGSALTFGQVVASDDEGGRWDAFAYAPSATSLPGGLCFDSMAVIDVDAVDALGGYTLDPQLAGLVDDLELLMRTLRHGRRVGYVPTVLGRYRLGAQRMSALVADQHLLVDRIRRMYLYDDPDLDSLPIFGAHPGTGVLWAAASTGLEVPTRTSPTTGNGPARPRIALLASGGVGNLGDDAITDAALGRIRTLVPDADIDLFTDRDRPVTSGLPAPWRGTLLEAWRGLDPDLLDRGAAIGGVDPVEITAREAGPNVLDPNSYDAVVVAGGGFMTSPFARDLLVPRVAIALACAAADVPVVWSGQGVGPCTAEELQLVAAAARSAAAFGCRDPLSVDLLETVAADTATLVGDDAMSVTPTATEHLRSLVPAGDGPVVVLHVRDASYLGSTALETAATAADSLAAQLGATVVGLAINDNPPTEVELLVRLSRAAPRRARWTVVDATGDPGIARGVLGRADAVVSHSYHVALWALLEGTPAVLVTGSEYYRQKALGLAELAGFPETVGVEPESSAAALTGRLDEVRGWLTTSALSAVTDEVEAWWARLGDTALKF